MKASGLPKMQNTPGGVKMIGCAILATAVVAILLGFPWVLWLLSRYGDWCDKIQRGLTK